MAIKAWKQFETSPGYQRLKVKLKRLVGKELRIIPDVEVDCVADGDWNYDASLLDEFSIVYSLGVGDIIDFDLGLIRRCHSNVYAFDPTPPSKAYVEQEGRPRQFHFYPWAAGGEDGTLALYPRVKHDGTLSTDMFTLQPEEASADAGISVPSYTVKTLAQKLGHSRIDLLKMDIEGAEYEVLDEMLDSDVRPKQLLVEFHHRFIENGLQRTAGIIARLREQKYRIIAVAEETGREITFRYMP